MHNRVLSGDELTTLIDDGYPFHSTAQLASYSLHHWNAHLLQEPTAIVNAATVTGHTVPFSTVGIVFTTSGSRVSQNTGNAFLSCTIGTLTTGPVITVLLFGHAVRAHCRTTVQPGTVVAVLQPKLLPQKENNSSSKDPTTVCFSISDESQLRRVGKATDYGRCCGTAWSKHNGKSSSRPCTQWIDVRNGKYCRLHNKQSSSTGTTRKKPPSTQHPLLALRHQQQRRKVVPPPRTATQDERKRASNSLLHPQTAAAAAAAASRTVSTTATPRNTKTTMSNPYAAKKTTRARVTPAAPTTAKRRRVTEDFLQPRKKDKTTSTRQKKLNIDHSAGGFDGSVRIPQPMLFSSSGAARAAPLATTICPSEPAHERVSRIQAQQQRLAQQLRQARPQQTTTAAAMQKKKKTAHRQQLTRRTSEDDADAFADAFGGTSETPASTIIQAQSQFMSQADAEAYVQWQQRATVLEQKEERMAQQQQKERRAKKIQTNWHCCDCEKSFGAQPPQACLRQNHKVKRTRVLPKTTTVAEQRQKQSSEEGGLVLGGGLEWSNWRGS